tara:strand:+ start:6557 stop:7036 length:480 start_codon:yes stop_codon:yes gene_type:complete
VIRIRLYDVSDDAWLSAMMGTPWGRITIVSRDRPHPIGDLELMVGETGTGSRGVLGLDHANDEMEVVILHMESTRTGLGRKLMDHARERAETVCCRRMWLVTTNANVNAQAFYEHLGMCRVVIHAGAIDDMRVLKPKISTHDDSGTPIRDEFEYEWRIQ